METVVVVLIVAAAAAWAAREIWRALRPRRQSGSSCGCPSASSCTVARNCSQAAPVAPAIPERQNKDAATHTT